VTRLEVGGVSLLFRPMGPDEAAAVAQAIGDAPEFALETAIKACEVCCTQGAECFAAVADEYPLVFAIDGGLCETLLTAASEAIAANTRLALKQWREGGRNLGAIATSLLAFKAYKGGAASAEALAGALHWAEHFDYQKSLFKLHLSFMKSMAKRR
jgi:hypothetical protein